MTKIITVNTEIALHKLRHVQREERNVNQQPTTIKVEPHKIYTQVPDSHWKKLTEF